MFARTVSIHLKSNMLSDYTRTFEKDVLPLLRKQKGFTDEMTLSNPTQPRCDCNQSVGDQGRCGSVQHQYLPRSVEDLGKND